MNVAPPQPSLVTLKDSLARAVTIPAAVVGILAIGGIARDDFVPGWSDIDLLITVDDNEVARGLAFCRELKSHIASVFLAESTVVLLSREQLAQQLSSSYGSASVLLNAFSGRRGCGAAVWGDVQFQTPHFPLEQESCKNYVLDKLIDLQRLLVKDSALSRAELARVIRWYSSIFRAALRCREKFFLPYDDLTAPIRGFSPEVAALLHRLFLARRSWTSVSEADVRVLLEVSERLYVSALPLAIQLIGPSKKS